MNSGSHRRSVAITCVLALIAIGLAACQPQAAPTQAPTTAPAQPTAPAATVAPAAPAATTAAAKPAAPAAAPAGAVKTMRLPVVFAPDQILTKGTQMFADRIKQETNGQLVVTVFPAGVLGGERDAVEGVLLGTIDMTFVSYSILVPQDPRLAFTDLPYLWRDWDHVDKFLKSPIKQDVEKWLLEKKGLRSIGWGTCCFREVLSKRPIKTMADMKGLKIRSVENEIYVAMWKAFGASPTPLPAPEMYSSLQTGLIEAVDGTPDQWLGNKLFEQAKYGVFTHHQNTLFAAIMNDKQYQALPENQRKALDAAGRYMEEEVSKFLRDGNVHPAIERGQSMGVTFSDIDTTPFKEATKSLWDTFGQKYGVTDVINRIAALK